MKPKRGRVPLPVELAAEIDKLVGRRNRSAWATQIIEQEIRTRQRKSFSVPDMIIAAVCISEDLTLNTDNRKDFTMPELKLHPVK
jgi:predicted nucleic acid-binding protein